MVVGRGWRTGFSGAVIIQLWSEFTRDFLGEFACLQAPPRFFEPGFVLT